MSSAPVRKPFKVQPKSTVRKSKAERDALERAENERKRIRAEAAAADAAAEAFSRRAEYGLTGGFRGGRGKDRGGRNGRGGRGGFMGAGSRIITKAPVQSSFFGGGISGSTRGRTTGRNAHAPPSVKRESGIKKDPDGDIAMLGIKKDPEDYGYISSEEDERTFGHRVNVDQINLISDDEEEDNPTDCPSRSSLAVKGPQGRRRVGGFMPIRISRKEHKDRMVGMNTEASSATSAALRRKAEEKSNAEHSTTFDDALTSVTRKVVNKVKGRSEEVEIVGKWKGVYDDEQSDIPIKQEPDDDSNALLESLDAGQVDPTSAAPIGADIDRDSPDPHLEPETKAGVKARIKQRRRTATKPVEYQTAEEIREWDKHQEDLLTIQQELGQINIAAEVTNSNDLRDNSSAQDTEQPDKKEDAIYLFQFPPIMPDLAEPVVKKEPESPGVERAKKSSAPSATDRPIKLEEDEFGGNPAAFRSRKLSVTAGWVGKLRVHKSGKATMTWGGTDMEMKMGINPYFLQTAILTRTGPEVSKQRGASAGGSADETGGEAIAFGQVRGKLVVTPNWSEILG